MATAIGETEPVDRESVPLIDCDIHIGTDTDAVRERLPEPFRSKGLSGPTAGYNSPIGVTRSDAYPDEDESQLDLVRENILDPLQIEHGIITGGIGQGLLAYENPRHAAAIATAYNEWVIEAWAEADDRIHTSVGIAPQRPGDAAKEIRTWGTHPDMVQIITGSGTRNPIGQEEYWPIFEAASEVGLPFAMHIGPKGNVGIGNPNNPAGTATTYGEGHIAQSINFYGQLASLVFEGVFESFPELTVVLIEGEFGWVPDLMRRMDRYWNQYPEEVPWLDQPPSSYVLDHVKFTTQPIPEPPKRAYLLDLLKTIRAAETLLFSTDYPHWDGDYTPREVFPRLPAEMERAIFHETAADLYGFE